MNTISLLLASVGGEPSGTPLRIDVPAAAAGLFELLMQEDCTLRIDSVTDYPPGDGRWLASLACCKESGEQRASRLSSYRIKTEHTITFRPGSRQGGTTEAPPGVCPGGASRSARGSRQTISMS